MLGYFRPDFSVLTEKEQENLKCLHCTTCKNIRKKYGLFSTLFLNYDFEFIYLTYGSNLSALEKKESYCVLNPKKKIKIYDIDLTKIADLTMLAVYISVLDKKIDKEFNFLYFILSKILKRNFIKVKSVFHREINLIKKVLNKENEMKLMAELYSNIITSYLNIKEPLKKDIYINMLEIMYYFDYFEDYFNDKKKNKKTILTDFHREKITEYIKEKLVTKIFLLKTSLINIDKENKEIIEKILEYSLQSKFNKINKKYINKKRGREII